MIRIIDPHIHFIDIDKGEYAWLKPQNPPYWPNKALINKTTLPQHAVLNDNFVLAGAVHVEAGFDNQQPQREVDWLESDVYPHAPTIKCKTLAFIDLCGDSLSFDTQLTLIKQYTSVVGFRYIFDDAFDFVREKPRLIDNLRKIENAQLIFEFQADFTNTQLIEKLHQVFLLLPNLRLVINHAGLPPTFTTQHTETAAVTSAIKRFKLWQRNIAMYAGLSNCFVKCSGYEMTSTDYTVDHVCKVLSDTTRLFGVDRVMVASNFPLTQFRMTYAAYWQLMLACVKQLALPADKLLYTNANAFYQL